MSLNQIDHLVTESTANAAQLERIAAGSVHLVEVEVELDGD